MEECRKNLHRNVLDIRLSVWSETEREWKALVDAGAGRILDSASADVEGLCRLLRQSTFVRAGISTPERLAVGARVCC